MKNLIFDFGNVVIRFDPHYMASQVASSPEEVEALAKTVFNPVTFELTDRGYVSKEKHITMVLPDVPDYLKDKAVKLLENWYKFLPAVEGMEQLLTDAKAAGYKLYLLSNINSQFGEKRGEIEILKYFDGVLLSSDVHFIKPEPEIYNCLIERYALKKEECLFIDDRQININGAEAVGISGYLFENAEKLREFLKI